MTDLKSLATMTTAQLFALAERLEGQIRRSLKTHERDTLGRDWAAVRDELDSRPLSDVLADLAAVAA